MSRYNIEEISDSIEQEMLSTTDLKTIDMIITSFEEAINSGSDYTKDMDIRTKEFNFEFLCLTSLEISVCENIIRSLMKTCERLEEYEMCSRISKILEYYES